MAPLSKISLSSSSYSLSKYLQYPLEKAEFKLNNLKNPIDNADQSYNKKLELLNITQHSLLKKVSLIETTFDGYNTIRMELCLGMYIKPYDIINYLHAKNIKIAGEIINPISDEHTLIIKDIDSMLLVIQIIKDNNILQEEDYQKFKELLPSCKENF